MDANFDLNQYALQARGLPGILMANTMSEDDEIRSVRTSDMGNEWLPVTPPAGEELSEINMKNRENVY